MAISFGQFFLEGISLDQPTDVEFGPDGKLYILEQSGRVHQATVAFENGAYQVLDSEIIDLVFDIPNHDLEGNPIPDEGRLALGIETAGTPDAPVLFVSSADPNFPYLNRGSQNALDSNSGTVSQLTLSDDGWNKVDLVRGLARGNTAHGINDMEYRVEEVDGEMKPFLYLSTGGITNSGGVGPFFFYQPESVYAAAILKIDLDALNDIGVQTTDLLGRPLDPTDYYIYDLPTVDDPTRDTEGDINPLSGFDVFGSNNGLNQVKWDPSGPVQIYATGFRNAVGLEFTEDGRLFTSDNGPSDCCDRPPVLVTNENGDLIATNLPNFGSENPTNVNSPDALYEVTEGFYAGHPNPIRASGPDAGLYIPGTSIPVPELPSDWDDVLAGFDSTNSPFADEGLFRRNGTSVDGSLISYNPSVNGISEYTGSFFEGELQNSLVLSRFVFSGATSSDIFFAVFSEDGSRIESIESINIGGTFGGGLGLTTLGDEDIFPGTVWVAGQISNQIAILSPDGEPLAPPPPPPPDDQDRDGLKDYVTDVVPFDSTNGALVRVDRGETVFWSFSPTDSSPGPSNSIFNLGLTGAMTTGATDLSDLSDLLDDTKFFPGGAVGQLVLEEVGPGIPFGEVNTLRDAPQFAITSASSVDRLRFDVELVNPIPTFNTTSGLSDGASVGFALGDGTQSDFVYFGVTTEDGRPGLELVVEDGDTILQRTFVDLPVFDDAAAIRSGDFITLSYDVDIAAGELTALYSFSLFDEINQPYATLTGALPTITLTGDVLDALQGTLTLSQDASNIVAPQQIPLGPVVSLVATSNGSSEIYPAAWNVASVTGVLPQVGGGAPLLTDVIALYTLSDGRPDSVTDASGNGNDGALQGGAGLTGEGLAGNGLIFDGIDDRVVIPHDDSFLLDEGTIAFWMNADQIATNQTLVSKDASFNGTGGHIGIDVLTGGQLYLRLQNVDATFDVELFGPRIGAGQWTHVAATWGQNGVVLYVNGTSVATNPYTGGLGQTSGGAGNFEPLVLGSSGRASNSLSADPGSRFFSGRMDEVLVSGTALSDFEVQSVVDAGMAGIELDQPTGNVAPTAPVLSPTVPVLSPSTPIGEIATVFSEDADGDELTYTLADDFEGLFSLDGTVLSITRTITPETLPASFVDLGQGQVYGLLNFTVSDGEGGEASTTAALSFRGPVGAIPVALDDQATTDEDTPVAIDVLSNDSDADSDALVLGIFQQPAQGIVSVDDRGTDDPSDDVITYRPDQNFNGPDAFVYTVTDEAGNSASATVTITVVPQNDAPDAQDDAVRVTPDEVQTGNVLSDNGSGPDSDVDGTPLTVSSVDGLEANVGQPVSLPSGGLVTVSGDGTFSFDPNGAYGDLSPGTVVEEAVTYTVSDGALTDQATLRLTIALPNVGPVAIDDAIGADEDTAAAGSVFAANPDTPDSDPEGGALTVTRVDGSAATVGEQIILTSGALFTLNDDGSFSFDPNGQFESLRTGDSAVETVDYTVADPLGATADATVTVTIAGVEDAPAAFDDGFSLQESTTVSGSVFTDNGSGADTDPDSAFVVLTVNGAAADVGEQITLASGALLTLNEDGTFSYDPNGQFDGLETGETGTDSFSYTLASAGLGQASESNGATVTLTIRGESDGPSFDLLSYWPGTDDIAPVLQDEISGFNGTLVNNAAFTDQGIVGQGLDFDGQGYVEIPHDPAFLLNDGGFSVWFNADTTATDMGVVSKDASFNGTGGHVDLRVLSGGTLWLRLQNVNASQDQILSVPNAVQASDWTHVMVGFGTGGLTLYLDGVEVAASAYEGGLGDSSGGIGNQEPWVLGASLRSSGNLTSQPVTQQFQGRIDEFAIFQSKPDAQTAADVYQSGLNGLAIGTPPAPQPPVAVDDAVTAGENTTISLDVIANDTDADDPVTNLSLTAIATPSVTGILAGALTTGTLEIDGNSIILDPGTDFDELDEGDVATVTVTYTVSDDEGQTDQGTAVFTVNGLNDAPAAEDDLATTDEDTAIAIEVLANDSDPDLDDIPASFVLSSVEVSGGLGQAFIDAGQIRFDPGQDFQSLDTDESASVTISYTLEDALGDQGNGTVSLTVTGLEDLPEAADDRFNVAADGTIAGSLFTDNGNGPDTDPDDPLAIAAVNGATANVGQEIVLPSGALLTVAADGTFTYTPNGAITPEPEQIIADSFTYTLQDAVEAATVTIDVTGLNEAPVAIDDAIGADEDTAAAGSVFAANPDTPDSDPEGGALTVTRVDGSAATVGEQITLASGALFTLNDDGSFSFDPNGRFESLRTGDNAVETVDYTVADPLGATADATVTVTIAGVEDAPAAFDDGFSLLESATVSESVFTDNGSGADTDPDSAFVVLTVNGAAADVGEQITLASGALLTLNEDGTFSYDPNGQFDGLETGETGTDSFSYTLASAGLGQASESNGATVTLTIRGESDGPSFDLLSYWPGTDDIAPVLQDEISGFNGTLVNNAAFTDQGIVGQGLDFDGQGYVEIPHDPAFLLNDGGFSVWFNADTTATDMGVVSKDASFNGTGGHVDLRVLSGGTLWLRLQNVNASQDQILSVPNAVQASDWTHVMVGFGTGGLTLYLDGVEVAASAYEGGLGDSSGGIGNQEPWVLGASLRSSGNLTSQPVTQQFQGRIDEFAIFQSKPDAQTAADVYQSGLNGLALQPPAQSQTTEVNGATLLDAPDDGSDIEQDAFDFADASNDPGNDPENLVSQAPLKGEMGGEDNPVPEPLSEDADIVNTPESDDGFAW